MHQNFEYYNGKINYLQNNYQLKTTFLLNILNNKDDQYISIKRKNIEYRNWAFSKALKYSYSELLHTNAYLLSQM